MTTTAKKQYASRKAELSRIVEELLPGVPAQFQPSMLALLGRGKEASELGVLVALDLLAWPYPLPDEDVLMDVVREKLLPTALLEAAGLTARGGAQ